MASQTLLANRPAWLFEELFSIPDLPENVLSHFVATLGARLQDISLAHHLPLVPAFLRLWLRYIKHAAEINPRACLKLLGVLWKLCGASPHLLRSHGLSPQQVMPAPDLLAEVSKRV
jgi:hypothetical protein